MERTLDEYKPAGQLNTTRKINTNVDYSHPAQPKRLALSVALSQQEANSFVLKSCRSYLICWSKAEKQLESSNDVATVNR